LNTLRLSILGSTGSIGTQTLDVVSQHPDLFEITALAARSNWEQLAQQANRYRPSWLLLGDEAGRPALEQHLDYQPKYLLTGNGHLNDLAEIDEVDVVLNSLVGFTGFLPTWRALKAGKRVALANKESLVVGGELITDILKRDRDRLIPVDSEHSAMLQCMAGEKRDAVERIIITASGGPFRTWTRDQMKSIRIEDALNHPNWEMGNKITIDSSTMMNKGLEVIEARWLFDIPLENIEPVIHPESIIHSIVEFVDGSSKAQLSLPDMRGPILYALTGSDRQQLDIPRLSWDRRRQLTFEPVDYDRFPCYQLAIAAGKEGGHAPAVMNAANEVAVERFLKKEITYIDIARVVERSLESVSPHTELTPVSLLETDRETRRLANTI